MVTLIGVSAKSISPQRRVLEKLAGNRRPRKRRSWAQNFQTRRRDPYYVSEAGWTTKPA